MMPMMKFVTKPIDHEAQRLLHELGGVSAASSSPPCQPMAISRYIVRPW